MAGVVVCELLNPSNPHGMPHQVDEEDLAEVWVLVNELTGEFPVCSSAAQADE